MNVWIQVGTITYYGKINKMIIMMTTQIHTHTHTHTITVMQTADVAMYSKCTFILISVLFSFNSHGVFLLFQDNLGESKHFIYCVYGKCCLEASSCS